MNIQFRIASLFATVLWALKMEAPLDLRARKSEGSIPSELYKSWGVGICISSFQEDAGNLERTRGEGRGSVCQFP